MWFGIRVLFSIYILVFGQQCRQHFCQDSLFSFISRALQLLCYMLSERQISTLPSERGQDFRKRMMIGDRVHGVAENVVVRLVGYSVVGWFGAAG